MVMESRHEAFNMSLTWYGILTFVCIASLKNMIDAFAFF